eukprot:scaffold8326_cov140-Amphora_coffeaeformis.AAC.6
MEVARKLNFFPAKGGISKYYSPRAILHHRAVDYNTQCAIPTLSITSPGHETPLASGVSTNVSVDVDLRQHDSEADVDARQHDPEQDQDQPAFNRLWNNQYAVLMELDM